MPGEAVVVDAYRRASTGLRSRTLAYVDVAWAHAAADPTDAALQLFADRAATVVEQAQYRTAGLTRAYLSQYELAVLGTAQPLDTIDLTDVASTEAMRGVTDAEMWHRVAKTFWTALSNGSVVNAALSSAKARAHELTETNLQLAHTHTTRHELHGRHELVGYRRITRGLHSCELCLLASSQRYHQRDLMPIHTHCHCVVAPIVDSGEAGRVIDPLHVDELRDLTAMSPTSPVVLELAGAARSADLSSSSIGNVTALVADKYEGRVVVRHHGEIGPVLTTRGEHFTGPSAIKS